VWGRAVDVHRQDIVTDQPEPSVSVMLILEEQGWHVVGTLPSDACLVGAEAVQGQLSDR
jgi:hypothetical protein